METNFRNSATSQTHFGFTNSGSGMPLIPSPQLLQVERSNGVIDVFDMGENPIDQARLLESNIIPQTPDPKSYKPSEVNSPRVIQAADSTQSRQIPIIIIDDEEKQPPVIEVIELE